MSDKPILFFSPKCKHSVLLWRYLKEKNLLSEVSKVNISTCSRIPPTIKSVPTLIVKNRPPIVGDAIQFYFNTVTAGNTYSQSPPAKNSEPPQTSKAPSVDAISDFMPGEMGNNWSDNYSFLQESKPIDHSFCFLSTSDNAKPSISDSMQQFKSQQTRQKQKNNLNDRLEAYKKSRQM